ncbi:MAG: hypothetical protein U0798_18990 [Gemmataceae bacterium]
MLNRARRLLIAGLATFAGSAVASPAIAQDPPAGVDVLARGPVHEAFASTTEEPAPTSVLNRRPPEPVEELPPDQKPDGENVLWIPGYWHYDEERSDFIWISGFWRAAPPGRAWVPGSWREVPGGHQWVAGFWQDVTPAAPASPNAPQTAEPAIEYLPAPPKPIEFAPSVPAPTSTSLYVSGSWVWRHHHFVWRPGFWINYRPGWVWTPAYYRWTPAGYVFVEGYWDYPLAARGTLFAPVYFQPGIIRPAYVYTPTIIVNEPCLTTSLFIRRGWGCYYFGDYFEPRYTTVGFTAWFGTPRGSGFAVGVNVGGRPHYDPLWDYYRIQHANNPQWAVHINDVYVGRYNGSIPRPPRTLVQQTTVINNITNNNITNNNTTIINNNNKTVNNVANVTMLTSFKDVSKTNTNITLKPVTQQQRVAEQTTAKDLQKVATQRTRMETTLAQSGGIPKLPSPNAGSTAVTPKIQTITLNQPKQVLARAQVSTNEKQAPPPNPIKVNTTAVSPPPKPGTLPSAPAPGVNSNVKTNPNMTTPNTTVKPGTNTPGTNTPTPNVTVKPGTNTPSTNTPGTNTPNPNMTPPTTVKPGTNLPNPNTTPSTTIKPGTNTPPTIQEKKDLPPKPKIEVKPPTGGTPSPSPAPSPLPSNNGQGTPVTPGQKIGPMGMPPAPNGPINRNPMPNGPVVVPQPKVIPRGNGNEGKGNGNGESRGAGNGDRRSNPGEKPPSK